MVNSQEAWAQRPPGPRRTARRVIELAHTLGSRAERSREPVRRGHSQNVTAENPQLNRRSTSYSAAFVPTDRSLMKPSATSPVARQREHALRGARLRVCSRRLRRHRERRVRAVTGDASVRALTVRPPLAFVMSGTTTVPPDPANATGTALGTSVVESYFASTVPQTIPLSTSEYRLVQRSSSGAVLTNLGVPVSFAHSEHGDAPHGSHLRALLSRSRSGRRRTASSSGRAIPGRPGRSCSTRGTDRIPADHRA